ncbi:MULTISPECIES: SAM-dependent methyltransferase [Mycolicibacter]|uniref:Class I SAM-dependent methyltransferase n=1 Tax=Mycolicibacter virginiensis TaxID=1795032 RepID=A0A9X7IQZ6_9MYCO|nr:MULTISPECIES: class I SAM-dependent methyltransferase [Mycolicibacter]OBG36714.1 SAM-dependent methyltransferase [Mycolicibacter heraklionensis]PQM53781.1 class I SAM-dependent methyltransferase [Mycolicibacter virginiensis]ULP49482.1 class I SAM-dependent methyltransferase [Mycolicibacter virginiensis]
MSAEDRTRWDAKYTGRCAPAPDTIGPAAVFARFVDAFPVAGHALDIACGQGAAAVWLAQRGLQVAGCDISPVAVEQARAFALRSGVGNRCRFDVVDLDDGLPDGPPADVIYCARFRDSRLDAPMLHRLAPGGLLAITALSQVGSTSGRFRAAPGELRTAFAGLELIAEGEADGVAWLLARRPTAPSAHPDGRD